MKKISGLNYIRAISAILIMLYHYTTRYYDIFYSATFEKDRIGVWWGCWAVAVFFVISGFLTVYNLESETKASDFIKKRVKRLYPAYWVCIIITTLVSIVFYSDLFKGIYPTLINFTMFQGFVGIPSVDGAYWTLRYELWFYILIVFVLLFKWNKLIDVLCSVWLLAVAFVFAASYMNYEDNIVVKIVSYLSISYYAPMFIAGVSVCCIHKRKRIWLSVINLILSLALWLFGKTLPYIVFVLIIISAVFLFAETRFSFKYDKPLVWIAQISYPLYLIHQNVGYVIIKYFDTFNISCIWAVSAAIAVSIGVAYLVHRFIEIPALKLFSKKD